MDMERRQMLQYLAAWSLGACTCCGCRTVPMTNRKQLLLTPESQEVAFGTVLLPGRQDQRTGVDQPASTLTW